jgi:hypothetical protein
MEFINPNSLKTIDIWNQVFKDAKKVVGVVPAST